MNKQPDLAFKSSRERNDQRQCPYFLMSRDSEACSIEAAELLALETDEIEEVFGWALLDLAQKKHDCFVIHNLLTEAPDKIGYCEPTNARTVFDLLSYQMKLIANRVHLPIDCEMSNRQNANYDLVCTLSWAQQDIGNTHFDPAETSLSMGRLA